MKKILMGRILIAIAFVCTSLSWLWGQEMANPAYHFEGDEVVFVFDVRAYQYAIDQGSVEYLDFSDLDIYDVAVSGNFNNWSNRGWKMKKKNKYTFELRKKVSDFSDAIDWDFKYIINGKHIITQALSFKDRLFDKDFLKDAFGMDLDLIKVDENGPIRFYLDGYDSAHKVILAGSFNNWDEHEIEMEKIETGWQLKCELPPGQYEYKFIVDGEWMHDPANAKRKRNEYDSFNSILDISVPVIFKLEGFDDAQEIILAGSFNDWDEHDIRMEHKNGYWEITLPLAEGKHHYKFIVDHKWYVDPANPVWEDDGDGNINSVLFVR